MTPQFPGFVAPCLEAFSYLVERFGFVAPVVEQLGRECFVRYQKGRRWVSIAYEPFSIPIVELFHPTQEIKDRRIPRLKTGLGDVSRRRLADLNEKQMKQTLQAQAQELENLEREFLVAID